MIKRLIILIGVQFYFFVCVAQTNTKGVRVTPTAARDTSGSNNVYALIIGISKYQNFPSLQFADNDARAFYDFLTTEAGGNVNPQNIRVILNEHARAGDIWRDIGWLSRKAVTKGDRVFIYFSGHGDAANEEEAYLLAHDAPNEGDPNLYNAGGTFQIYNLKEKIKQMTAYGVQVVLVTDACRSNELPGKAKGAQWTYNKIMEKQSGEIQMTSCTANEKSMESVKWGGGRGVFSWYLINGLSGLADEDPEDTKISLYELQRYVKSKVRAETHDLKGDPLQTPMFCCSEMENVVLSKITSKKKMDMIAAINNKSYEKSLSTVNVVHHNALDDMKRFGELYRLFGESCKNQHLVDHDSLSANFYYNEIIRDVNLSNDARKDLDEEFISVLVNYGQQAVNYYLRGKDYKRNDKSYLDYSKAAQALSIAISLREEHHEQVKPLKKIQYMLDSRALYAEFDSTVNKNIAKKLLYQCIANLDSADALMDNDNDAMLYHTYGLIFNRLRDYRKSNEFEFRAISIAPQWVYPNCLIEDNFIHLKQLDSAMIFLNICTKIDPNYMIAYANLASYYYHEKDYSSAEGYMKKCIQLDPEYLDAYYDLACLYSVTNDKASAFKYLELALIKGWTNFEWIKTDNDLDNIRKYPEFHTLVKKYFPSEK